jgi:transcription-repair coupling factor (superfamily II helicase)
LAFLQTGTNKARLKQTGRMFMLIVDSVKDMESMHRFLTQMHKEVVGEMARG